MGKKIMLKLIVILLFLIGSLTVYSEESWVSRSGYYKITYQSEISPININTIHNWTLTVTDPNGNPVNTAKILIEGGMPLHNHGLPTIPIATKNLGNGKYLIEGFRFHMRGKWELSININANDRRDTAIIHLNL